MLGFLDSHIVTEQFHTFHGDMSCVDQTVGPNRKFLVCGCDNWPKIGIAVTSCDFERSMPYRG